MDEEVSLDSVEEAEPLDGLGLQGQHARSSVINIFEDSCTEEVTVVGKAIFDITIKFSASEERKKFDITY